MLYQFRVHFEHIAPPVWRQFVISSQATFWELSVAIQALFNWDNHTAHEFIARRIEPKAFQRVTLCHTPFDDLEVMLSQETTITGYFNLNDNIAYYHYPVFEPWYLKLKLEAIVDAKPNQTTPQCLNGQGVRPCDDWGSAKGWHTLQKVLKQPKHPEHEKALLLANKDKQQPPFDKTKIVFPDPDKAYQDLLTRVREANANQQSA